MIRHPAKQAIGYYLVAFLLASGFLGCFAEEKKLTYENCTKEELMMAFPFYIVKEAMLSAGYSQDLSTQIAQELALKDKNISKIVDERAEQLHPNPFKDLSLRDQALKIYQETLYDVFSGVLKANGINNEAEIQSLLEKIRLTKSKLLIDCLRASSRSN